MRQIAFPRFGTPQTGPVSALNLLQKRRATLAFLEVQAELGSFDRYIWSFVDGKPIVNHWRSLAEIPASTPLSEALSRDLKKRGFRFVGPTIIYAHMQATGMVNDHIVSCFRHPEIVEEEQRGRKRADYGERILEELARRLAKDFGSGYSVRNLRNMRQFFGLYPGDYGAKFPIDPVRCALLLCARPCP